MTSASGAVEKGRIRPLSLGVVVDPPTLVLTYLQQGKEGEGKGWAKRARRMPLRFFNDRSDVHKTLFTLRQRHGAWLEGVGNLAAIKLLRVIQEVMKGAGIDEARERVELEFGLDPDEDLNKVSPLELERKKEVMEEGFQEKVIRPDDAEFEWDRREEFGGREGKGRSEWDEDEEGEEYEEMVRQALGDSDTEGVEEKFLALCSQDFQLPFGEGEERKREGKEEEEVTERARLYQQEETRKSDYEEDFLPPGEEEEDEEKARKDVSYIAIDIASPLNLTGLDLDPEEGAQRNAEVPASMTLTTLTIPLSLTPEEKEGEIETPATPIPDDPTTDKEDEPEIENANESYIAIDMGTSFLLDQSTHQEEKEEKGKAGSESESRPKVTPKPIPKAEEKEEDDEDDDDFWKL